MFRVITAAALVASFAATPAVASVVLDQSTFTATPSGDSSITGMVPTGYPVHQTMLQTVTAGVSGALTRLDLKVRQAYGSGNMELLVFNGGYLGEGVGAGDYGNVAARVVFSLASLPQKTSGMAAWDGTETVTSFDLSSAAFRLVAGQVYSFSLRSAEPYGTVNAALLTTSSQAYTGGRQYVSSNIGLRYLNYNDPAVQFRTFVDNGLDVAAVPEPATWAMMMLGFGTMGYTMRRKNKATTRIRFS